jgi:hypothetical protein
MEQVTFDEKLSPIQVESRWAYGPEDVLKERK